MFFQVVARTIDANREFADIWAGLVGSLTAVVREQAETGTGDSTEEVVAASRRPCVRVGVPIDEAAKYAYRRADSATLLGLLPELRRLGKAAQKEHERIERELSEDIGAMKSSPPTWPPT